MRAAQSQSNLRAAPSATGAGGTKPRSRSAMIKAHDDGLHLEIAQLEAQLERTDVSTAAKHGLRKQLALRKAALKKDVVPTLAQR